MTEPCDLSAHEARRLIGRKQLSPVELVDSCIARIEAVDHAVNAFVAVDFDLARAEAQGAEAMFAGDEPLPLLHGLPVGVKDLTITAGLRTTWGSPIYRDHVPDADEALIAQLRRSGAIIIGKTNTPEFGAGGNTRNAVYGATGNPFDPAMTPAGSSGGSAVALATGMVPLATGTDVAGSLRNPAAYCGIVGFRPSSGYLPYENRLLGWSGMSMSGPMARTVRDTALMLAGMLFEHDHDPLAFRGVPSDIQRLAHLPDIDLSTIRAAFTPDFGIAPIERAIAGTFETKARSFRHVFRHAADDTPDCDGTDESFAVLRAVDFYAAHADRVRDYPDSIGPNVRGNTEEALRYSAVDVAEAEKTRTAIFRRWQRFFGSYDVLITPTVTISPRPWRELYPVEIDGVATKSYFHWLALAYAVTLVGHPAVSIPAGLDHAGMPFGLQIVGRRGDDARLLAIAAAIEDELARHPQTARPVPDLKALRTAPPIAEMPGFMGYD